MSFVEENPATWVHVVYKGLLLLQILGFSHAGIYPQNGGRAENRDNVQHMPQREKQIRKSVKERGKLL